MGARLHEVLTADVFCRSWGLNPCLTLCDGCLSEAKAAMERAGVPDLPLWADKSRREHDEAVVKAAKRLIGATS